MSPTILSLESTKLRRAMSDFVTMQRWEVLRRAATPMGVQELSEACRTDEEEMQRSLDLLVEAGLAVRLRATTRVRKITYRSVAEHVVIKVNRADPEQASFMTLGLSRIRAYSRGLVDSVRPEALDARVQGLQLSGCLSLMLTVEEAEELKRVLRQAWAVLGEYSKRAWLGQRGEGRPEGTVQPSDADAAERTRFPFHVSLEFHPLDATPLPLPEATSWSAESVAKEVEFVATAPAAVLSPRELEVARLLASGRSRPEIARALRLSLNTIGSMTRRIYAKLSVRNRAEFTSRMQSG